MTFSIVGRCAETGQFGMAVSSSSPAVAARCAHARAGVGAVASQNVTDPRLGAQTLDAMEKGMDAETAVAQVIDAAAHTAYRQVLAVTMASKMRRRQAICWIIRAFPKPWSRPSTPHPAILVTG